MHDECIDPGRLHALAPHVAATSASITSGLQNIVSHTILSALGIAREGGTLTVNLDVQVGPLYVLVSIVAVIFFNLGKRGEGEASAYSIFNGFRELPGQLNAGVLDDQIRRGQM